MPPGSLVIDGGANVGRVTSVFVRQGFEVHAFEPDPAAYAVLNSRFGAHPRVHLHQAALGVAAGRLTLHRTREFARRGVKATTSSSLFPRDLHAGDNAVEVEVVNLAAFIGSLGRRLDLLKLDVEGSEVDIVERLIADGSYRQIGAIYAETHERHSADLAERTARLRRAIDEEGISNIDLNWR